MKPTLLCAIALLAIYMIFACRPINAAAEINSQPPVVVELFTSQSCSSCPPADKVLAQLAHRPGIIALSCHVTYWDHLGWRDTLSNDICTKRQYAYAAQMGKSGVYTPQMVVNGTNQFVGSQSGTADDAITSARQSNIAAITITKTDGGQLHITLPTLKIAPTPLTVLLIGYAANHEQAIGGGENGGGSVTYINPVTFMKSLHDWDGITKTFDIATVQQAAGYAVIVQQGKSGSILAAGQLPHIP